MNVDRVLLLNDFAIYTNFGHFHSKLRGNCEKGKLMGMAKMRRILKLQ